MKRVLNRAVCPLLVEFRKILRSIALALPIKISVDTGGKNFMAVSVYA